MKLSSEPVLAYEFEAPGLANTCLCSHGECMLVSLLAGAKWIAEDYSLIELLAGFSLSDVGGLTIMPE